jgi:alpha-beta hydrolase superfamily lysophospholipase
MPDPHIDMLVGQADLPIGQHQAQIDLRVLLQELQRDRQQMALAESDRRRYLQPPAQRTVVAGCLALRRLQFLQYAA